MMKIFPYFDFVVFNISLYRNNVEGFVCSKHLKYISKDFNVYIKLFTILYAESKEDL
jgi:hypothetical protein